MRTWHPAYGTFLSGSLRHWRTDERTGWFVDGVTYIAIVLGFNRGLDLLRSPISKSEINYLVTSGFGQDLWGVLLMVVSAYMFAAVINPSRHLLFYYTASLAGGVVFGSLFAVMLWGFLQMGPPFYGVRFITPPLGTALLYLFLIRYQLRELPRQILGPYQRRSSDPGHGGAEEGEA